MMAMRPATKMSYQLTLKMWVKVTVYKIYVISALIRPISTKISPNDAVGADNKSVASADLGNVGQAYVSQRVLSQLLSKTI